VGVVVASSLVMAAVGALVPARSVTRLEPAEAFRA
jgi:ABC-type antimicrobial peptide transport system permease subunit